MITGSDSATRSVSGRILDANGNGGTEFPIDSTTLNTGTSIVPVKGGYLVTYSKSGTRMLTVSDSGALGTSSVFDPGNLYVDGASSETETLIVWSNGTDYRVHGRFFKDATSVGKEFTIAEGSLGYTPAITWDGSNYLVVWEIENHNLLGRTVSSLGELGSAHTLVADDCAGPVLASDGKGQVLLSYAKYGEQSQSRRVYSRLITQNGNNVPEATGGAAGASNSGQGGNSTGGATTGGAANASVPNSTSSGGSSLGGGSGLDTSVSGGAIQTGSAQGGGTNPLNSTSTTSTNAGKCGQVGVSSTSTVSEPSSAPTPTNTTTPTTASPGSSNSSNGGAVVAK